MRAVILESVPGRPKLGELPKPHPQAGELLVKVLVSSVNGFDGATVAGHLRQMLEHRFPLVPGRDFAGTVEAVGADVTDFAVGDEVFGVVMKPFLGAGSFAEYVTVPATHAVTRLATGLSLAAAGALGLAGTTAWHSVNALHPSYGETVLISGATGGVGSFAVQLAISRGARVIATARPGRQADFIRLLTEKVELVNYTDDLTSQVTMLAPDGVDAVLHLAGDGEQLVDLLPPGGRMVSVLGYEPEAAEDRGVTATSIVADPDTETLDRLATEVTAGVLQVPLTAAYPLDQVPQALADLCSGAVGKLAVNVA